MKIVITGAGGLVGRQFSRQLSLAHDVLPLTHQDLDVTNRQAVWNAISYAHPRLIINCAVLGVDRCEGNPELAYAVNAIGAQNLADAAVRVDASLVHLSSNYVFDGNARNGSGYTQLDPAHPINVYGQTKFAGERLAQALCGRTFIVRTSWVFGSGKNNFFSRAPNSLKNGETIRAIIDVWANATYVRDLVKRIDRIISHDRFGIYHVVNSDVCSYYDFAVEAAKILGLSDSETSHLLRPVKLAELSLRAPRPRYTPLRCTASEELALPKMRSWRQALAAHIRSEGFVPE